MRKKLEKTLKNTNLDELNNNSSTTNSEKNNDDLSKVAKDEKDEVKENKTNYREKLKNTYGLKKV